MASNLMDWFGEQNNLSGLQDWAKTQGASGALDPSLVQLAQSAPRTFAEMAPALVQRSMQMSALAQLAGGGNQQTSPAALPQMGGGDSNPGAPVPQALPAMADPSQQDQQPSQPQMPGLSLLPAASMASGGDPDKGIKLIQAMRGLSIPPGVGPIPAGQQYVNGKIEPIPGAVETAANTKQAEKAAETGGTNLAEAQKTLSIMQANLPVVMQRLNEMKTAAIGDPNRGLPPASYGFGVDGFTEGSEGDGPVINYHNTLRDQTSVQNAILRQRAAQGVLPELGPQLAQAGIKGNKFLETLATEASGIKLSDSPEAKSAAIDGLAEQYLHNLQSTAQQVKQLSGGKISPSVSSSQPSQQSGPDPYLLEVLRKRGLVQ